MVISLTDLEEMLEWSIDFVTCKEKKEEDERNLRKIDGIFPPFVFNAYLIQKGQVRGF